MGDVIQEIKVFGFDPHGEPIIRVMSDGAVYIVFESMPPSIAYDEQHSSFDEEDFYQLLKQAVGVEVIWEDRERLLIPKPRTDTVELILRHLESYGQK